MDETAIAGDAAKIITHITSLSLRDGPAHEKLAAIRQYLETVWPAPYHLGVNSGEYESSEQYECCATSESLLERLRELNKEKTAGMTVRIFQGIQIFLSKGPQRHLLLPGKAPIPLTPPTPPEEITADPDGYVY